MVELDDCVVGPKPLLDLFPADDLAVVLCQDQQNVQRLLLEPYSRFAFAKLARFGVEFEGPEAQPVWRLDFYKRPT
jgi:hypothetical protein